MLLGFWFVMQLFSAGTIAMTTSSSGGGVAFAAHVVGFLAGMGGVFLFKKRTLDPWDQTRDYCTENPYDLARIWAEMRAISTSSFSSSASYWSGGDAIPCAP